MSAGILAKAAKTSNKSWKSRTKPGIRGFRASAGVYGLRSCRRSCRTSFLGRNSHVEDIRMYGLGNCSKTGSSLEDDGRITFSCTCMRQRLDGSR